MSTAQSLRSAPDPDIDVDCFDDPFHRAANAIAVLHALAAAQSTGDTPDEQYDMWWGIRDLTERALADLKTLDAEYTKAANYIYHLEHGGPAGQEARTGARRSRRGGAR